MPVATDGMSSNITKEPQMGNHAYTHVLPSIRNVEPPVGPTFGVARININGTGFGEKEEKFVKRIVTVGGQGE